MVIFSQASWVGFEPMTYVVKALFSVSWCIHLPGYNLKVEEKSLKNTSVGCLDHQIAKSKYKINL